MSKSKPWPRTLIVSVLMVLTALIGLWHHRRERQSRALNGFLDYCTHHNLSVVLGAATDKFTTREFSGTSFVVKSGGNAHGTISRVVVSAPLWGVATVAIDGLSLKLSGEPIELFSWFQSLSHPVSKGVEVAPIDLSYEHPVFGTLTARGATFEQRATHWVLRSNEIQLGERIWRDVALAVGKRGDFLEVGLKSTDVASAKFQVVHFKSPVQGAVWSLRILHQSLRDVATALSWQANTAPNDAHVVGSITLSIPPGESVPRGSLHLTFDNWPKPPWKDADALLGTSGSLFARIAPVQATFDLKLPYVEVTLPLYTLVGTGTLSLLHSSDALRFDVQGRQPCFVFSRNVPTSIYQTLSQGVPADSTDASELHLQLDASAQGGTATPLVAHLSAQCGLPELSHGTFETLTLPTFEPRKKSK